MRPLRKAFFERPADLVARELLGAQLTSSLGPLRLRGIITETEAYLGRDDPASHAYGGRRHAGNASLYGPPGTWYVYRSYGIHWCANLVCGKPGPGGAVLLRGLFPVEGVSLMRRRRRGVADRDLTNGPGKLCQALGITLDLDGAAMWRSPVLVGVGEPESSPEMRVTPRIGITKAVDWPLRFVVAGPANAAASWSSDRSGRLGTNAGSPRRAQPAW
ncbi:MAG TPA: DNA-3-methyladenine glycosylase [Gemmatimonadales bacterium]|nr:DNA-3-methyladenine glycosylase [Gemmatimonadales bacterium]